jgi:hypothetical protein
MDKNLISKIITGEATDQKKSYYKLLLKTRKRKNYSLKCRAFGLKPKCVSPPLRIYPLRIRCLSAKSQIG